MDWRATTLLLAATLTLGSVGAVAAQELDLDAVGIGGRVEPPGERYVLTLPPEWVYVYPTSADAEAIFGAAAEAAPDLAAAIDAALSQGVGFSLIAFGDVDREAGFAENCNVIGAPAQGITLELAVASEAATASGFGDMLASGPDVSMLELPVGNAARIDYGLRFPGYETVHSTYYFTDGTDFHVLTCTGLQRPDDAWLSIAETFEYRLSP